MKITNRFENYSFDIYLDNFPTSFIPFCKILPIFETSDGFSLDGIEYNSSSEFDWNFSFRHYWHVLDDNNCILKVRVRVYKETDDDEKIPIYFTLKLIIDKFLVTPQQDQR